MLPLPQSLHLIPENWLQCKRNLEYVQGWRCEQLPSIKTCPSANSGWERFLAKSGLSGLIGVDIFHGTDSELPKAALDFHYLRKLSHVKSPPAVIQQWTARGKHVDHGDEAAFSSFAISRIRNAGRMVTPRALEILLLTLWCLHIPKPSPRHSWNLPLHFPTKLIASSSQFYFPFWGVWQHLKIYSSYNPRFRVCS